MAFRVTVQEFADMEFAVGQIPTTGEEDFEFKRFADGDIAMKVWVDGESSSFCRLADWIQGVAATREP